MPTLNQAVFSGDMTEVRCPVCENDMHTSSWFDEEGVEAWECDTCGFGKIGDWSEPPDFSSATAETVLGWHGETLGELRAAWQSKQGGLSPVEIAKVADWWFGPKDKSGL